MDDDGDGAVFHTDVQTGQRIACSLDLFRQSRGSCIIVVGRYAQQGVPNAASHQNGLVPGLFQQFQNRCCPCIPVEHMIPPFDSLISHSLSKK